MGRGGGVRDARWLWSGDAGTDGAHGDATLEGPSPDSGSPGTAFEFCLALGEALIPLEKRCYGGMSGDWRGFTERECARILGGDSLSVDYDRAAAETCLAGIAALAPGSCDVPDCLRQVVKGRLTTGQPCDREIECGTSGFCLPAGVALCAPKSCVTYPEVGEACQEFCARGAVCGPDHLCVPFAGRAAGEPCGGSSGSEACALGLRCRLDPTSDAGGQTCRAIADGLPCASDGDCPLQDFCDAVCKPRLPLGAPCAEHPTGCIVLGACSGMTKICVSGGRRVGDPCGARNLCLDGWCDVVFGSNTCFPMSDQGGMCAFDENCVAGRVCTGGACHDCP
jgi:hypothetical protein